MIQLVSIQPPVWQQLVHQLSKTLIVVPLEQVHHLVDDNVLKTLNRFLRQFQVEPNAAGFGITAPPFCFHLLHAPGRNFCADGLLPPFDHGWDQILELAAVPSLQYLYSMVGLAFWPHMEFNGGLVTHEHFGCTFVAEDTEAITLAKEIVAFTADHVALRLTVLAFKSRLLAFDPPELADHC